MIRKTIIFCAGLLLIAVFTFGQKVQTRDIVENVLNKGVGEVDLGYYTGSLLMHAMSEYAVLNKSTLAGTTDLLKKYATKEIAVRGNFISYECGGSGAAYLSWLNVASDLDQQVAACAAQFFEKQKRSPEGLMTSKHAKDGSDQIFIDVAFAVSPFLLYAGLKLENQEYIDFAVFEVLEIFRILKDNSTGLVHQARGFTGPGILSQDNWSRGNGWGAFALAALVRDLPESHPRRGEVVSLAKQFFTAAIDLQNKEGLWHQEMTDPTSYVETSGSGLLLYGMGIMLEAGLLDGRYLDRFVLGLQGLLPYIGTDGSVSHTCSGCLNPGQGTKEDYKNKAWVYNDHHAFGAVILAFAQAAKMGVNEVEPSLRRGLYTIQDSPNVPRTYTTFARGSDLAWENDRVAFRLFGPAVRDKVGSGVDIWAKRVDYPILDKWYTLNENGQSYHTDRGEGCDFYDMGRLRGCGAIAVWANGVPYAPETFDTYRILKNQDDGVEFAVDYKTWHVPGMVITENKIIQMERGTNLFRVTSTLKSDQEMELTVAIGVTTFGKASIYQDEKNALLSSWEQIDPENGALGTAVLADPRHFVGYAAYQGDEFVLVRVKTNVPFTYYAGAGWEKSKHFPQRVDWENYVKAESANLKF